MNKELKNVARILVLLLCAMMALSVNADIKIATVGDSITQGVPYYSVNGNGCTNCGGYQPWLESLIDAQSWSVGTVYNYGIAGEFSDAGSGRITDIIKSINPDYVMFMEGTNDLAWYVAPETIGDRAEIAVNNTLAGGKIPIIGTLLPDTNGDGATNSAKQIPQANEAIRNMLVAREVQLAELYYAKSFSEWDQLMVDGLHPNTDGYRVMANVWYAALKEIQIVVGFLPVVYLLLLE